MNIETNGIREILANINEKKKSGASVSRYIAELLVKLGVKEEILKNPNNNTTPKELYSTILALSESNDIRITPSGVEIRAQSVMASQNGEKKPTDIVLSIKDGDISIKQFYKKDEKEVKVKSTEITTGTYSDGETVVRTLDGEYSLSDKNPGSREYNGEGVYTVNEFGSDGVQMGTRVISVQNTPSKVIGPLSYENLYAQERYTRSYGLSTPISADMQKDILLSHRQSPSVKGEFVYYRNPEEIDKLNVVENYDSVRSGVEFALFSEHGTDSIRRIGVVEDISKERYDRERQEFYSSKENIEEMKRKSPLASTRIEASAQKYMSERSTYTS